ncbi:sugar transporter [Rhodococcus opacus PD630]|uniref:MFS transporter n=1 Tax=Rhodococcus opacus TaxID=37919 RepID=UPI00029CB3DB|nr:MFS transporter [Rhodococcus opacus]AHK34327.1 Putative metabolite transport protein yaaU [Rhodococcus opacus PD630]EHI39762.1 sugar transporter [Rhodococcus opacus PD630]UDG96500.1 MFS transporter [Rhodococcus opacus PD630]
MTTTNALDDAPLSAFHKRLAFSASGGPFLDGYVLSIIGVAMVHLSTEWGLTTAEQGVVGISSMLGIFVGGILGGRISDLFGRRIPYTVTVGSIAALSLLQFFVDEFVLLLVLRVLIGVAIGADYPIATSLLTEFSPNKHRGPILGYFVVMWFVGAAAAYVCGQLLTQLGENSWRWMLVSAAAPAVLFLLARAGTPESPRWLTSNGRIDRANDALRKAFGPDVTVEDIPDERATNVDLRALLRSGYGGRLLFVTAYWTASIVPLFAVYAFAPAILDDLGFGNSMEQIGSAVITVTFMVGCIVAASLVNKIGRRPLMIHSFLWSAIALVILGLFPNSSTVTVMALFLAYAIFIGGTQIMQQVYPNELFPTEIRSSANGLATSLSRIGAAIGTYLVPVSLTSLGVGTTMLLGAAITAFGAVIAVLWAPETRGLSLSESSGLSAPEQSHSEPVPVCGRGEQG